MPINDEITERSENGRSLTFDPDVIAVIDTDAWEVVGKIGTDEEPDERGWYVIMERLREKGAADK